MMIISFAWTTDAFKANRKTVTRRYWWSPEYVRKFKVGDICKAYDKQPRFGGKQIGLLKIVSITHEPVQDMPDSDYEAEGFAYMQEKGLKIWGEQPKEAFENWRNSPDNCWVIRFKKIEGN